MLRVGNSEILIWEGQRSRRGLSKSLICSIPVFLWVSLHSAGWLWDILSWTCHRLTL